MFFRFRKRLSFGHSWLSDFTKLRTIALTSTAIAALSLSACVESQKPLLTDTKPTLGNQLDIHLYERFVGRTSLDFHATSYTWSDGKYTRVSGLARDVASFVYQPIEGGDFIVQGTDETQSIFNYWIGRKLLDGVYLIFPLNEADSDAATRDAACAKNQPDGICMVGKYDDLISLARATAARSLRDPSLGIIVAR